MTVLMREHEGFDTAGAVVQRVVQTLDGVVEDAVAVGQPTPVEPLKRRRLEGLFRLVELLRIGWLPAALGDLPALSEMVAHVVQQRGSERRGELLGEHLRIQLGEPLWPRRYDD